MKNIRKQFLIETEHTGRFIIKSFVTGKVYYVEPIERGRPRSFGDIDPATKKVTGSYGMKYRGAVKESESLITKENGFDEITLVRGSYMTEIERREKEFINSLK